MAFVIVEFWDMENVSLLAVRLVIMEKTVKSVRFIHCVVLFFLINFQNFTIELCGYLR